MGCPPAEGAYLHAFQVSRFSMLAGISPLRALPDGYWEKGILFFVQFHAARIPCCVRREDYVEERPQPACLGKWLCLKDIRASAGDLMVA